jgi:hypothetical protein
MLLITALLGCPYVDDTRFEEEVRDVDGDGVLAIRFDGRDCDDNDPTVGDCDNDRDGFQSTAVGGDDCDDTRADVNTAATEVCDGIDNDCDGRTDDADDPVDGRRTFFVDADEDGFGTGEPLLRCDAPAGTVEQDGDCDDGAPGIRPGVAETCDGVDRNCDGDPSAGAVREWFADADGDGFGDPLTPLAATCERPDPSAVTNPFDCDDTAADAHPASLQTGLQDEICDGIDNDCDGLFDLDDPDLDDATAVLGYPDTDGDGFGDANAPLEEFCFGFALNPDDCDDTDAAINPGASERCDTPDDDDCDGLLQTDDPDNDGLGTVYLDVDGDGVGSTSDPRAVCEDPVPTDVPVLAGYAPDPGDCNDADPSLSTPILWHLDNDDDGFGAPPLIDDSEADRPVLSCFPVPGRSRDSTDCNDDEPAVNPVGTEVCDELDNDCNGVVDDGAAGAVFAHPDLDGDGVGAGDQRFLCSQFASFSARGDDCDDTDPLRSPLQPEDCGPVDRDCDGVNGDDDPDTVLTTWYRDQDLDGFGEIDGPTLAQCAAPLGYVDEADDCNDADPQQYFATYFGAAAADADDSGVLVDDLAEVLVNAGRCRPQPLGFGEPEPVRTVVELSADDPFVVAGSPRIDAYTTIVLRAPPGERATVCWNPNTSVELVGGLELERVDLVFGIAGAGQCIGSSEVVRSPFVLVGHPSPSAGRTDWSQISLTDVDIPANTFKAPLVASAPESTDPNLLGGVRMERMSLSSLVLERGLVDVPDFAMGVVLHQVALTGLTTGSTLGDASLFRTAGTHFFGGDLTLDDVVLTESTITGALVEDVAQQSVVTRIATRRLDVRDAVFTEALFCVGTGGCAGTAPVADPNTSDVDLVESRFARLTTSATSTTPPPLARLSAGTDLRTTELRSVAADDADAAGPWVTFVGDVAPPSTGPSGVAGWTATRDRLDGRLGGLSASGLDHRFTNVHVSVPRSTPTPLPAWDLVDLDGTMALTGVSIVQQELLVGAREASFAGLVLVEGADLTTPVPVLAPYADGLLDPIYTIGPTPLICATAGCTALDDPLDPVGLVAYDPAMDPARMVPFPRLPFPSGLPFDTTPPSADPALFYDGTQWSLDPNTDGLPVAWLQLQAADPSCWPFGPVVFGPGANPDNDLRNNAEEALDGTWPCLPDVPAP